MNYKKVILFAGVLILVVLQFGCSTTTPAVPYPLLDGYTNYTIGEEKTVTVGDRAILKLNGPTRRLYVAVRNFSLDGLPLIHAGSIWHPYYWYPEKNALFLTSQVFHPQLAILVKQDGTIFSKQNAAYQIAGLKTYRRWSLADDNLRCFKPYMWDAQGGGFSIYYLGHKDNILRFSIAKYIDPFVGKYSSSREKLGDIEYNHNLNDGKIFTIRGIRIQIDKLDSDGTLHFIVIGEKETNEVL